jgi:O-antigen/teichoic acid export membrane protein
MKKRLQDILPWNVASLVALLAVSIAVLPVYWDWLGDSRFALLSIIWTTLAIGSVLDFGLSRAVTREVALIANEGEVGVQPEHFARCVSSGVLVGAVYAVLASLLVGMGLWAYLVATAGKFEWGACLVVLAALSTSLAFICNCILAVFDGLREAKRAALFRIWGVIATLGLPVMLYQFGIGFGLEGILAITVLSRLVMLVALCRILSRFVELSAGSVTNSNVRGFIRTGKWLTLSNVVSICMTHSDRYVIGYYKEPAQIVAFSLAADLIQRGVGVLSLVSTSAFPFFARTGDTRASAENTRTALCLVLLLGLSAGCIAYLTVDVLLQYWLSRENVRDIAQVFKIMLVGWLASGLSHVFLASSHGYGDSRTPALAHMLQAIVFVPTIFVVVPTYGVIGAAVIWSARAIVDSLMQVWICLKKS